ncbi:MAG: TrwC relaxase, partial [Streptosporangiaceae bacterium]|nr:TrwC relaxase [Streptosporangiaceae bacterium]
REWAGRATAIEQAVLAGHRAALAYLEDTACYVRTGHHGTDKVTGEATGKWLKGQGLIAAQFLQHDSRDRDPNLHVHGPIQNLARGEDGKMRGLDRARLQAGVAGASAIGHRVMEAELVELGLDLRTRPDGVAREVVGVDEESRDAFSSRRRAITPATEKLIEQFREETGHEPTAKQRSALAQRATLATRAGKYHGDESQTQTLDRWADKHRAEVGADLGRVADRVFAAAAPAPDTWSERDVIERALATVSAERQSFTRDHVMQHIADALPGNLGVPAAEVRPLLESLTNQAVGKVVRLSPETADSDLPPGMRRADGASVYANPRPVLYATKDSLAGEQALREAAVPRGAPVLSAAAVATVIAAYEKADTPLGADQAAALSGIATSGAMLEVLSAPAGTGKTFAVGALARVWEEQGAGRVRGIAFGQLQADELSAEGVTSRNIQHWLVTQERLAEGRPLEGDHEFAMTRGDLIVVDETQLAGTPNLVKIRTLAEQAGAKVLFTGDPAQGGMGPSGALGDLVGRAKTYELVDVRRFTADWEGPASLRLRDGDTSAVTEYANHGRLVDAGAIEQAEAGAARSWLADTLAGKESLVVCASNEGAARVCAQLRAELVALGRVEEAGVPLKMQGTFAGVGDLIQARYADRGLGLVNRSRFRVQEVLPDGALRGAPVTYGPDGESLGEARTIPADYVREHVALGYASTSAAAIGRTVDSCYGVVTQGMSRATAYVIATRGRVMNRLYLVTQSAPQDAVSGETAEAPRRDAAAMLNDLVSRPNEAGTALTATAQAEQAELAAQAMPASLDPLVMTLADLTHARTGQLADQLAVTGELPEKYRLALATDPATRSLTQLLRTAELAGHDPATLLGNAAGGKTLDGSISVAQVLHARIRLDVGTTLPPRVESFRDLIPTDVPADHRAVLERWADAADARRGVLGADAAADPPPWTRSLGPVPDDLLGRADWEQKAGWAASYREWAASTGGPLDENDPLGAAPPAGLVDKRAVWQTAHDKLGLVDGAAAEEEMTEGRLRVRVAAYEREKNWAPRYVADELQTTYDALHRTQADAVIWAARAEATADPAEKAQLTDAADRARSAAEQYTTQIPQLEEADQARVAWYAHTAGTREAATRARAAMAIRGIDPDSTDDHVTAAEWLQAHRAERAEVDQYREIRDEHDLVDTDLTNAPELADEANQAPVVEHTDDKATDTERADGSNPRETEPAAAELADAPELEPVPELETGVPDLREISQIDEKDSSDSASAGRIPLVDETTAAVERAQAAVAEISARGAWDTSQETAEVSSTTEPDESARAAELNRYAADDHAAEVATSSASAGASSGD